MDIIASLFGFVFSLLWIVIRLVLALIAAVVAIFKGRRAWFWAILVFIFPISILIAVFMPRKYPKFGPKLKDNPIFKKKNPVISSVMALSAMVANADGNISDYEMDALKSFVTSNFGITEVELRDYESSFQYGKEHPEDYQEFTDVLMKYYKRKAFTMAIAYLLIYIAMSDGSISQVEEKQIKLILKEFDFTDYDYESIVNSFIYQSQGGSAGTTGIPQKELIKKYSKVLNVDENASLEEVRAAYRSMIKEYHPDKMSVNGMPDDYKNFAEQKTQEINDAYEYLKKVKKPQTDA